MWLGAAVVLMKLVFGSHPQIGTRAEYPTTTLFSGDADVQELAVICVFAESLAVW